MTDLSLTQEYMILSLNERGEFPLLDQERPAGLVAGVILEMSMDGSIRIDGDKIELIRSPDLNRAYLHPVFDVMRGLKKLTLQKVIEAYMLAFSDKAQKALFAAVKDSLERAGQLEEVEIKSFFRKERTYKVPRRDVIDRIVQKIRAEILEDAPMTDETVALTAILHKNGLLKQYFSKYESGELKKRLEEIKQSDSQQVVKKTLGYLEEITAVYIAVIAAN